MEEVGSTRLTSLECVTTGHKRVSGQFPGPTAEKPTRMAGCCDVRYLTMWFVAVGGLFCREMLVGGPAEVQVRDPCSPNTGIHLN